MAQILIYLFQTFLKACHPHCSQAEASINSSWKTSRLAVEVSNSANICAAVSQNIELTTYVLPQYQQDLAFSLYKNSGTWGLPCKLYFNDLFPSKWMCISQHEYDTKCHANELSNFLQGPERTSFCFKEHHFCIFYCPRPPSSHYISGFPFPLRTVLAIVTNVCHSFKENKSLIFVEFQTWSVQEVHVCI